MLHVSFQNIKGLPHFGVRWRVFFNNSSPSESLTFNAWSCSQTFWQISKFASVAATEMSSPMDIHSSYSPFAYLQEVQRQLPTITSLPAKWTTFNEMS
ncbi:hypothetical protein AVEN_59533-1 [Araneus ventricosus]|uniref:Uncharacterized protein n=1 Tax=Araneus ventricosus TaxID=182803 RepID=A0A4Y2NVD8_ARAVE|nr:hypothetical protein AVEN_59533-1 [Araneus ventricosus]